MAIAIALSVTVSIAADIIGILSPIFLVRLVEISTSAGRTADSAGIRSTSSKVSACRNSSCAIRHGVWHRYLNDSIVPPRVILLMGIIISKLFLEHL